MKITCNNCEEVIQGYLCDLPSEWRSQIAAVICKFLNHSTSVSCSDVKKCETLTSLSAFSINGSQVCIDYTDENGVVNHRCFDMTQVGLNLNPKCIMSQQAWDALTWEQQIQAIIDYRCTCSNSTNCICYSVHNTELSEGLVAYKIKYIDCNFVARQVSSTYGDTHQFCAIEGTVVANFNATITDNGDCTNCTA